MLKVYSERNIITSVIILSKIQGFTLSIEKILEVGQVISDTILSEGHVQVSAKVSNIFPFSRSNFNAGQVNLLFGPVFLENHVPQRPIT